MEIVKRYPRKKQTLWRDRRSFNGRRYAYSITEDRDGVAIEPASCNFTSIGAAQRASRWADRQNGVGVGGAA